MSKSLNDLQCIPGINWLRALLSVAVVAWHMSSFGKSLIFDRTEYGHHVFALSDLVNFHVLLLAVPTFFLISCYLYARKNPTVEYLKKRIFRFALLALFWTVTAEMWIGGYQGLLSLRPTSLHSFITTILSAGHTLYYFFVSLLILTIVTHIFCKRSTRVNAVMFVLGCLLVFLLPRITITHSAGELSAFWNPMNFIPYPFAAILMARNEDLFTKRNSQLFIIAFFLTGGVLLGFYEWRFYVSEVFFYGQGYAVPAYTRLSVVCLSVLIFSLGMTRRIRTNVIIDFMSRQSLALYCLHPFFIVSAHDFSFLAGLRFSPFLIEMSKLVMVVAASYITSVLFKKIAAGKAIIR